MEMERLLHRRGALVRDRWVDTEQCWDVTSPATGERIGTIGVATLDVINDALDAAETAMAAAPLAHERAESLEKLAAAVETNVEEFAQLLAWEAGKPVKLGKLEVARAVSTLRLSAVEALKLAGHAIPMNATAAAAGRLAFTIPVPVGIVAAITPFNFPLNLACHKLGPAIAAGCPIILKPADKAPLAACLLAELACEVGLPTGWVSLVVAEPAEFAGVVADDRRVGLITFTGSSAIGWSLQARAPRKRVTLELGNVTPVIVDATAPIGETAERLARSAFAFAGQSCISTQRIYVEEGIASEFEEALVASATALAVGDPLDSRTDVGPLITAEAAQRISDLVSEVERGGGRVLTGGTRTDHFVTPAVVADAPANAGVLCREAFGPVVSVQRWSEFDAAIEACNATEFGLQAGIFSQRLDRCLQAASSLDFAGVIVNEVPTFRADQMPYGGNKESGNTREGPAYAVREMTHERLVCLQS